MLVVGSLSGIFPLIFSRKWPIFVVFLVILVAVFSFYYYRYFIRITRPLREMAHAAQEAEKGKPDIRVGKKDVSGFDDMLNIFNSMSETLRESQDQLKSLLDAMTDIIFVVDEDGRYLDIFSDRTEQVSQTEEKFKGRKYHEIMPKEQADIFFAKVREVMETNRSSSLDYSLRILEKERYFSAHISPLRDAGGKPRATVWICRDITEHKHAEYALRESKKKYQNLSQEFQTVLDALPDKVTLQTPDFQVIWANSAAVRSIGKPIGEINGSHCYAIWQDRDKPCNGCPLLTCIESRRPVTVIFSTPDCRHWEIRGIPLVDDGKIRGIVEIARDITEKKELEKQLVQSQKMEAVGTLAGGIAHDFNNLLQAIKGYTQLMLMEAQEDTVQYNDLKEVESSTNRAAELTQQLLTFSRKVESKRRPININQIVENSMKLILRTIPKMIEVNLDLTEDLNIVNADAAQIEQIILNLAVNARDAMPDGGQLTIGSRNVVLDDEFHQTNHLAEHGSYVRLTVSDTGHGMDGKTMEHIFEPFYTTKGIGEGTGLGLAMVYGIVKDHEGYIGCSSRPGKGTTFNIYIPVTEDAQYVEAEEEREELPYMGDETILLVDDEASIRKLGKRILTRYGYNVLLAASAEEALKLYKKEHEHIDLIILDLNMPGMGGKKCIDILPEMYPEVKILVASGFPVDDATSKVIKSRCRGLIKKPYEFKKILELIRSALK